MNHFYPFQHYFTNVPQNFGDALVACLNFKILTITSVANSVLQPCAKNKFKLRGSRGKGRGGHRHGGGPSDT